MLSLRYAHDALGHITKVRGPPYFVYPSRCQHTLFSSLDLSLLKVDSTSSLGSSSPMMLRPPTAVLRSASPNKAGLNAARISFQVLHFHACNERECCRKGMRILSSRTRLAASCSALPLQSTSNNKTTTTSTTLHVTGTWLLPYRTLCWGAVQVCRVHTLCIPIIVLVSRAGRWCCHQVCCEGFIGASHRSPFFSSTSRTSSLFCNKYYAL